MKKQTLAILFALSTSAFSATSLDCQWVKTENQPEGFFQNAELNFKVDGGEVQVTKDTFLDRQYTPCWTGNASGCYFSFSHYSDTWSIQELSSHTLTMTTDAAYWDAEISMVFAKDLKSLVKGEKTVAVVSGNDGDGVMIEAEVFNCTAK